MKSIAIVLSCVGLALAMVPATAKTTSHMTLAPGAHKGDFVVQYTSLIPYAPRFKRNAMLWVDADQRVPMRQYLGLPIDVRIHPTEEKGIYAVQILRENGSEITEMRMGFMPNDPSATSTFVDQRIMVRFSDWKKLIAQPFPTHFAAN